MDEDLEYSWSNGQYWSKYNHCRVWENGTYTLKVRDKYGQTATTTYAVTNNHTRKLNPITYTLSEPDNEWSKNSMQIHYNTNDSLCKYLVIYEDGRPLMTTNIEGSPAGQIGTGDEGNHIWEIWYQDIYGNRSPSVTINQLRDTSAPTNINFVPTLSIANEIYTEVSAIEDKALPLRYSITYDGGQTWSTPQIGRNFGLVNNPPKGTYTINCRAYNAAGLYVEGSPVQVTIS